MLLLYGSQKPKGIGSWMMPQSSWNKLSWQFKNCAAAADELETREKQEISLFHGIEWRPFNNSWRRKNYRRIGWDGVKQFLVWLLSEGKFLNILK